ncbi:MAG TPA: DUF1223 domain-containing protein [Puia sp.]|nr:DUF1223 domain-containing protein [Puia sp.]
MYRVLLSITISAAIAFAAPTPHHIAKDGFAVVELFTSEGCSSCPPADELLAVIAKEYPENVYVLSFHVDYWDRLGWKDVYSSPDYTHRQQEYAQQFSLNSIYTPQAVVNGKVQFVGSDGSRLRSAVEDGIAAKTPADKILLSAKCEDGKNVKVSYSIDNPGKAALQIALVQSRASSQVLRGENQGHKLEHVNVVRAFQSVSPQSGSGGVASLKLPDGLTMKDCKIVGFLQDKKDGRVLNAKQAAIQ